MFYVNARNPVDGLTTEQIKGIYSGDITDWRQIGVLALEEAVRRGVRVLFLPCHVEPDTLAITAQEGMD